MENRLIIFFHIDLRFIEPWHCWVACRESNTIKMTGIAIQTLLAFGHEISQNHKRCARFYKLHMPVYTFTWPCTHEANSYDVNMHFKDNRALICLTRLIILIHLQLKYYIPCVIGDKERPDIFPLPCIWSITGPIGFVYWLLVTSINIFRLLNNDCQGQLANRVQHGNIWLMFTNIGGNSLYCELRWSGPPLCDWLNSDLYLATFWITGIVHWFHE